MCQSSVPLLCKSPSAHCATTPSHQVRSLGIFSCRPVVLLWFSKSRKRTVSDGFVKKSADSDSVSDSRRRHYKLIYTRHRAQRSYTGGRQMRRRCTSQAIVPSWPHRRNTTTGQLAVCPTHPARTPTSDAPPAAMQAATHRRRTLHNAKTACHPP